MDMLVILIRLGLPMPGEEKGFTTLLIQVL